MAEEEHKEPEQKATADKWIANDMIFLTGGKGFGIADSGGTICIGDEKGIRDYLSGGKLPDNIWGQGESLLTEIKESLKEKENGETERGINAKHTTRKPIIGNNKRIRPGRVTGHKQPNIGRPKTKKGATIPGTKPQ